MPKNTSAPTTEAELRRPTQAADEAPRGTTNTSATHNAHSDESSKQPLRRRREESIRMTALDLILERGYSAVTMDDVAEHAGVSRRTVFNYFPSKADMLGFLPMPVTEAESVLIASDELPFFDSLRELFRERFSRIALASTYFRHVKEILCENPEVRPILDKSLRENMTSLRRAFAQRYGVSEDHPKVSAAVHITQAIERSTLDDWMATPERDADSALLATSLDRMISIFEEILNDEHGSRGH